MPITIAISGYSIAASIIFTYVGSSGEYAVAGYGAATRIEQVVLLPVLGINTALISIIAQNFGANYLDRVKQTYFTSIKYGLFIMIISGILVYITSDIIPNFFSRNFSNFLVSVFGCKNGATPVGSSKSPGSKTPSKLSNPLLVLHIE